jgi:AraC family transcriptional regulator, regulatory protein of adaptative response / methylated-DNA-[protein]-cysteine methyltransferase
VFISGKFVQEINNKNMEIQQQIDYKRIEKAIEFIENNFQNQPSLKEIADSVNISEFHFDRMFSRWAGTSPQRFMRFLTKEYAKNLLEKSENLQDVTFESGLSSSGRLHDLFVTYEAMTPGEYKRKGEGLTINYGTHETPFGDAFIATTERGILSIAFLTDGNGIDELILLKNEFLNAQIVDNQEVTKTICQKIFSQLLSPSGEGAGVRLLLRGTNFQIKVWEALLKIPSGRVACYEDIAKIIEKPTAQRAVGSAIGSNHLAYIIPCHRVIQKVGTTGNYRWGTTRKKAMLAWEAAQVGL